MARKKYLTEEEIVALIDEKLKPVNDLIESLHPPEQPPPESEMYQDQNYFAIEPEELKTATEAELEWNEVKERMDRAEEQRKRGFWNFFWWR